MKTVRLSEEQRTGAGSPRALPRRGTRHGALVAEPSCIGVQRCGPFPFDQPVGARQKFGLLIKIDASKVSSAFIDECSHGGRQSPGVWINNLYVDGLCFKVFEDVTDLLGRPVVCSLV